MSEQPQPADTVTAPAPPVSPPAAPQRLLSLDAFRGLIMLMMASAAFEVARFAQHPAYAGSEFWQVLAYHGSHAEWRGCSLWDLIQPSFMFMVGVALAFSAARRKTGGQQFGWMFLHALWRGILLVLIAVFLTSYGRPQTTWLFANVLSQIGLGYPFLFLLAFTRPRIQWIAAGVILLGTWLAFVLSPAPHWEKNANVFTTFDLWFLNLFPREKPFVESGGYHTLNFIPSLATMIFGLLAGQFLRSERCMRGKVGGLVVAGIIGLASGWLLDFSGVCPMIKHIWTPSFALFSGGWVVLFLAAFFAVIEWAGYRRWAFPLLVAGLNPITLYVLWQSMGSFIKDNVRRHFGQDVFSNLGRLLGPELEASGRSIFERTMERIIVLLVLWLILLWMYRRKIVVRI